MDRRGSLNPETAAEARTRYDSLTTVAETVTREVASAMGFGRSEYRKRVTDEVVETAREALFASFLCVRVGTRTEFEEWCVDHPEYEVSVIGNEHVENVAWHASPAVGSGVAATFQNEPDAAVGTLRRQAFGQLYRPLFTPDDPDAR